MFNILSARIAGCRFLDLFAGTGAVGLEALSRGAELVHWVESGRQVIPFLKENIKELGGMPDQVICMEVLRFLKKGLAVGPFDIIFADPPYQQEWRDVLLGEIGSGALLAPGGLFILEESAVMEPTDCLGWTLVDRRVYGDSALSFFRS